MRVATGKVGFVLLVLGAASRRLPLSEPLLALERTFNAGTCSSDLGVLDGDGEGD